MRILAGTDFSTRAHRAVRRAGMLAREAGGELILMHVVEDANGDCVKREAREAERMLAEQRSAVPEVAGSKSRCVVASGEAADLILQQAIREHAQLLVLGSPRKRTFGLFGRTIRRLLCKSSLPLLVVKERINGPYTKALAPIDLTELSAVALKRAKELDFLRQAELTLVHAFAAPLKGRMWSTATGENAGALRVAVRSWAVDDLATFLVTSRLHEDKWSGRVEEGAPLEVIARCVQTISPDLLVMGTRGRSGLAKALLGSIVEEVLISVNVDTLIIPPLRSPARAPAALGTEREARAAWLQLFGQTTTGPRKAA